MSPDYYIPQIGCYWVNDERHDLTGEHSLGWAIEVDSNDIYVAGSSENEQSYPAACYWKNNEKQFLDVPTLDSVQVSDATDLCIYNNNIYICGYYDDNLQTSDRWTLCYWKNGVRFDVSPTVPEGSKRPKICVDDTNVYIATDTSVWIDNNKIPIENESGRKIASIFVNINTIPTGSTSKLSISNPGDILEKLFSSRDEIKIIRIESGSCQISIIDLRGRELLSKHFNDRKISIKMDNLQNGLYLIKVQNRHSLHIFKTVWKGL